MSCPFNDEQLAQLKAFVGLCKMQPAILNHPKLDFFKDYLVSLGVKIPAATFESTPKAHAGDSAGPTVEDVTGEAKSSEDEEPESDVELDMEGVIESQPLDESQDMGDASKEVTEEEQDKSDEKRTEAMKAFSEQQYEDAIKLYTEAIKLNPHSALLFAKRGQVYLKLNKLHSCIKDCSRALELNCDSAAAYKFRGRAYRLLGKFEEASHDLCESLKIDYDDQTNEWLNEVKPNAEKLRQHKLSVQRKKEEKEHREKLRRLRKAQEARAKAAKAQADSDVGGPNLGGFQFPNFNLTPETLELFQDPEVQKAFLDITSNPANIVKYQDNPKIISVFEKVFKQQTAGGAPGGAPESEETPKPAPADDDVGLD